MSPLIAIAAFVAGAALLTAGGEILVKGAAAMARRARVSPAVIGLTVVSIGTSVPELAVSVFAALQDANEMALGNVVGSNILNVALIVGLTALFIPLPVHGDAVKFEWPFMFGASIVAVVLGWAGQLVRWEGFLLLAMLVGFNWFVVVRARSSLGDVAHAELAGEVDQLAGRISAWASVGMVIFGIALLVSGGRLLVNGAIDLARLAGVTERVIGLTVVAFGTSLPELATSVIAARRGHADMAVANVIGSNIFNILGVLGTIAIIHPVPVPRQVEWHIIWMLGFSAMLFPMIGSDRKVDRKEGMLLLASYGVYLAFLFQRL